MKKLIVFCLIISILGILSATTIFNEDFENGATNWTIVNGTVTNKWHVGTATANGGTHSIYISTHPNGETHDYNITSSSVVHFYRDVTFPANAVNIVLNFDFLCGGESTWDWLRVFLHDTTFTPVAGTTAPTTDNMIGDMYYNFSNPWTTKTILIPAAQYAGTTKRLVFTWRNDTSVGTQPPAAIDNIILTHAESAPHPSPALLVAPANNSIDRPNTQMLSWTAGEGSAPTSYKMYFGTSNPPTTMTDLGLVTSWVPSPTINFNTQYYWKVVPYNAEGDAVNCPVWTFTTMEDPTITTFPHTQNFDTTTPPNLPFGWMSIMETTATAAYVDLTTFGTPNSLPNQLRLANSADANALLIAHTPYVNDLNTKRVKFFAKGGLDFPLQVGFLTDPNDSSSFTLIETVNLTANHEQYIVPMGNATNNYLAFRHGLGATYRTIYIDDVIIENLPEGADFNCTVTSIDFGQFMLNQSGIAPVTVSNLGSSELTINQTLPAQITANFPNPVIIGPGQSQQIIYTLTPTSVGAFTGNIVMNTNATNAPTYTISVTANILPPPPEGVVQIGSGDVLNQNLPWEPYYRYTYSQTIYYPNEINRPHGESISSVGYYYNGNSVISDLIQIYMGYTDDLAFSSNTSWVPVGDLTLVFDGEVTTTNHTDQPNWLMIDLDTPFSYNANSNLVIAVREYQGGPYHGSSDDFYCQAVPANRSLVAYRDAEPAYDLNNLPGGTLKQYIPNTRLTFDPVLEGAHLSISPTSIEYGDLVMNDPTTPRFIRIRNVGSENVTVNSIVLGGANAGDFELLNIPTLPAVLEPVDMINISVLHTPTAPGQRSATITITDNINRNVTVVVLSSNSIDYTIVESPYYQNFDTLTPPVMPPAWNVINTTASGYIRTINTNEPFTTPNQVVMYNANDVTNNLIFSTSIVSNINLKRISFYAKKGAGTDMETLIVGTIEDPTDPETFEPLQTIELTTNHELHFISLTNADHDRIAFKHPMLGTYDYIYIDNITIENLPEGPVFYITPLTHNFGEVMIYTSPAQLFTIQNTGTGVLSLQTITIAGDDAFSLIDLPTLPANLNPNQTTSFRVRYNPTSAGEHSATVTITDNLTRTVHTVEVSGECFDPTQAIPYFVDFEEPANLAALNWTGDMTIMNNHGVDGSRGLTRNIWSGTQTGFAQTCPIGPLADISQVRFQYRVVNWSGFPSTPTSLTPGDSLNVKVSTDGVNFTTVYSVNSENHTTSTDFAFVTADLSAFANQVVFIRFDLVWGGTIDSYYNIDEVMVRQTPEGVDFYCPVTSLNFGNILQFTPAMRTVNIQNLGTETLIINVSNPPHMTVDLPNPINIPAGNTQALNFTLNPPVVGAYSGVINITTNDTVTPTHSISVSANVLAGPPAGYVQIGAGELLDTNLPWEPFYRYTYSQTIYYPHEINIPDGNLLTSVSYHYNGTGEITDLIKIYMGYTSENTFASNTSWIPLEDLTLLFDGQVVSPEVDDWVEIEFEEEFVYFANQNLVIAVLEYQDGPYHGSTNDFYGTAVQGSRSLVQFNDSTVQDPANPPAGTLKSIIPNTRLQFEDDTFPRPRYLVGTPGNNEITLSWDAPNLPSRNSLLSLNNTTNRNTRTTLSSYKVYKNGQEVVLLPATQTTFTDYEVINGIPYTYFVTAIYSSPEGESNSSNLVYLAPNGPILNPPSSLLASVTNNVNVTLNWYRGQLALNESFETAELSQNWINIDSNGDDYKWEITNINPKEGYQSIMSRSRDITGAPLSPNNWLISPSFSVTTNTFLNYWVGAESQTNFAENYLLLVSTSGPASGNFETILVNEVLTSGGWQRRSVNLSEYQGMTIHIAFVHSNSTNQSALKLDGVQVVQPAANYVRNTNNKIINRRSVDNVKNNERTLMGFKVYRNGQELTQVPASTFTYVDQDLPVGEFDYMITAVYSTGESSPGNIEVISITTIDDESVLPLVTQLKGNYPNPFNPETTISFDLAKDSKVVIDIFNIKGQKVTTLAKDDFKAGRHNLIWNGTDQNGRNVSSGVYFYKMSTENYNSINKMILMK